MIKNIIINFEDKINFNFEIYLIDQITNEKEFIINKTIIDNYENSINNYETSIEKIIDKILFSEIEIFNKNDSLINKIKFILFNIIDNNDKYNIDIINKIIFKYNLKVIKEYNYKKFIEQYQKVFVIRKQYNFTKPFIVQLTVTDDIVELRYIRRFLINNKLEEFELFNCYLNRFELMKRNDWKDNSKFSVHLKTWDIEAILMKNRILEDLIINKNFNDRNDIETILNIHAGRKGTVNRNGYLVNISALLQNGRIPSTEDHAFFPGHRVFNFFLKFKDSKFTELFLSIPIDPETTIEHNCREIRMYNSTELKTKWKNNSDIQSKVWQPQFRVNCDKTEINCNEYAEVNVQLINSYTKEDINKSCEVYLENINGYLPKNRITLDNNGFGKFKIYPLYLDPGDKIKIKIGFRYFQSKQEIEFKVVV